MSHDCCAVPAARKASCPVSGTPCRAVGHHTIEALLKPSAKPRLAQEGSWFFCPDADCDVVYFDLPGKIVFRRDDLTVRVGSKEREAPRPLCYCFGHTAESLQAEIESTGTCTVAERITAEVQAGRCRCEVTNPSGRCCLGEIRQATRALLTGAP